VEGDLYKGACGGLGYSYLMTVYAGSPRVVIDVTLRNSINASCGRLAKISRAFAGFNLGFTPANTVAYDTTAGHMEFMYTFRMDTIRSTRAFEDGSGAGLAVTEKWAGGSYENFLNRTTLSGRRLEVEIIQPITDTLAYGTRPASWWAYVADSASTAQTGTAYVYYLLDYAHKTSQIVLECYNGTLTSSALRSKMFAMKHRLVPRQAPADVSASAAFSLGKFGTLADEQACHTAWGWQACDPFPTGDVYHNDYKIQRNPSRTIRKWITCRAGFCSGSATATATGLIWPRPRESTSEISWPSAPRGLSGTARTPIIRRTPRAPPKRSPRPVFGTIPNTARW
jgi:hypothetical protein